MNFDYFWMGIDEIQALPYDISFGIFSAAHLTWLLIVFIAVILYAVFYVHGSEKRKANMRYVLALICFFSEIFKMSFNAIKGTEPAEYLPLKICSIAEYVILMDCMWPKNKFFKQMLIFAFFPATLMALFVPATGKYSAVNIITLRFFILHGAIAAYVLAQYAVDEIRPRYSGLWISHLTCLLIALALYPLDLKFGLNFLFLTDTDGNPLLNILWNISGGKGGYPYIAALAIFVLIAMHIMYGVYRIVDRVRRRKGKRA